MTPRRRRWLERTRPRDMRELVWIDGYELTCDDFKRRVAQPSVAAVDAMPKEWRELIHEYGGDAHDLFDASVPMFANQRVMTAAEARKILERARDRRAR